MSDSGSSRAVIISCAAVGAVILLFLAVKIGLCIHRRARKPVPLPPARPLAALHTLPWNANPNGSTTDLSSSKFDLSSPSSLSPSTYRPEFSFSQHGVPGNRARNVYRQYSGSTLYTEELPLHQPPSPLTRASSPIEDASLVPPQPSFFSSSGTSSNRSSAQLSMNSSTEDSDLVSYLPQRHQSMTAFPSDPLAADDSGGSLSGTPSLADSYPRRGHGTGPQRLSVTTSVSTVHTTRSKRSTRTQSAIRGPPHKPYSRVEVVLPAPLASPNQQDPSSYLHELYGASANTSVSNRGSVCDPWLRVGRESTGPALGPSQANGSRQSSRERERRHRTVSSESRLGPRVRRPSASSMSSFTANSASVSPNLTAHSSRSPSVSSSSRCQPYPNPLRQKGSSIIVDLSDLPPVPRVPSMYTNGTNSPVSAPGSSPPSPSPSTPVPAPVLALSDSITGNGRLRGLESDSAIRNKSFSSNGNLSSSRSEVIAADIPARPVNASAADGESVPSER